MSRKALPNGVMVCLGAMLLICMGLGGFARAEEDWSGHWVGAVLVRPAEFEFDVTLDISRAQDGRPSGQIVLPGQDGTPREVSEMSIGEGKISFVYDDGKDRSQFKGLISKDGKTINGTLAERGKTFPFILERRPSPANGVGPAVRSLSPSGAELKEQFSRDGGHVRMIAILSPTCPGCQNCARIVRRYVFEKIADPDLRAYVIWEPIFPEDGRAAAEKSAKLLADPRVTHFWADERSTGNAFQKVLGIDEPAWDVVLVFKGDRTWRPDGPAPTPDLFVHSMKGNVLPEERRLNGLKLAEELRAVLAEHRGGAGQKN